MEQLLRELPVRGDAEFLRVRADLQQDLDRLRRAHEGAAVGAGFGRSAQALTQSDGCTTEWWHEVLLGVAFLHTSDVFFNQCAWHDYCYSSGQATYGFSRGKCDSSWLNKMQSRCESKYPWYVKLTGVGAALYTNCLLTAEAMHAAVRLNGSGFFMSTACVGGQIWPKTGWGGTCSTYEAFDSAARICTGADGERADGTIGANWSGCRGSGCSACGDALVGYPNYFKNNPLCTKNPSCGGEFYKCGSACPAPDWMDR